MGLMSEIWRSFCLGYSLKQRIRGKNSGESVPEPDKSVTPTGPTNPRPAEELNRLQQHRVPTDSEPSVVIFVPPPPILNWKPPSSVDQASDASRRNPFPNQPGEPKVASTPPTPEEPVHTTNAPPFEESACAATPSISEEPICADALPRTKKEYMAYATDFVKKNIGKLVDPADESIESISNVAAAQADLVTAKFGLRPDITPGLVKLAFYDFVILCDDSSSMTFDPERIPALKDTLSRVAQFATILQPKGISIRFLNHDEGTGTSYNDVTDVQDITTKVGRVSFFGDTRLGGVLDEKIVQPMIIQKLSSGKLKRPVFVVIITDGQPTNEHPETLRHTIRNCKNFLKRQLYQDAAAIFLISQIGDDSTATAFLKSLETDQEIGSMVFCSTENLANKLAEFRNIWQDRQYTAWLIELFLAALDKQTKRS